MLHGFSNGFSGPKSFRDVRETGPRAVPRCLKKIVFLTGQASGAPYRLNMAIRLLIKALEVSEETDST